MVRFALVPLFAAAVLAGSSAAATPPSARACPSVAIVNKALGQHDKAPVSMKTPYSKICTYAGASRIMSTKITFQTDTAAQFAVDEKAAATALGGSVIKIHGLGKAAWGTVGSVFVYDGHEQIKILSPLVPLAKLEALARRLI